MYSGYCTTVGMTNASVYIYFNKRTKLIKRVKQRELVEGNPIEICSEKLTVARSCT